jgi:hypothetical protein
LPAHDVETRKEIPVGLHDRMRDLVVDRWTVKLLAPCPQTSLWYLLYAAPVLEFSGFDIFLFVC